MIHSERQRLGARRSDLFHLVRGSVQINDTDWSVYQSETLALHTC